jgi:hypothetical protein
MGSEIAPEPILKGDNDELPSLEYRSSRKDFQSGYQGPTTTTNRPVSVLTSESRHGEHLPCALSSQTRVQWSQAATAPQSSDVVITKPNAAPSDFPSFPNYFLPNQSRTRGPPIADRRDAPHANLNPIDPLDRENSPPTSHSGAPGVPAMVREDVKSQPVKRFTKSSFPPLPRLIPGLLDPTTTCKRTLDEEDCLYVPQRPRNSRLSYFYRIYSRPLDIPKLDYGLPEDFGQCIRLEIVADFADLSIPAQSLAPDTLLRNCQVQIPMSSHPLYRRTAGLAPQWHLRNEYW